MICKKPYQNGLQSYGCGQCMPCRVNRARMWTGRMVLESLDHPFSCFVTLTYNPEHVPIDGSVSKRAVQLFLKKLRQEVAPRLIRFYAVGEYGDKSWRPHYHLVLYGVSPTEEEVISKCWPYGFIQVGTAEQASISYVCGYIVKKMTNPKDARLDGRLPEFSLMSRRPGIGFGAVAMMSKAYLTEPGQAVLKEHGWIVSKMRTQGFKYPLGDYLKRKVVVELGLSKLQQGMYRWNQMKQMEEKRPVSKRQRYAMRQSRLAAEAGKLSQRREKL